MTEIGEILITSDIESFVIKQLQLLEIERDTEIEENKCLQESRSIKSLQKKGVCIPKLRLGYSSTGLFGRTLLHFESFFRNSPFLSHCLSSGDIVGVGSFNSDGKIEVITSGIVIKVAETSISVAFEKNSNFSDIENDIQYLIIKLANDVTYKRLKRSLKLLQEKGSESHLANVLFGISQPSSLEKSSDSSLTYFNNKLNHAQKEAVQFALTQKELAILHGPPGTGKTTTVLECILQATSQKLKVLACAPSNVAVDNLVEKLAPYKVKMVRLGHPARFSPTIQQYSLDAIVSRYDGSNVVEELHKEIDQLREKISKTKGSRTRKTMWAENRSLLKEVKEREKFIVKQILKNADVVLSTLTSASEDGSLKYAEKDHFDICVIDECSQATEAACWIPLLSVKRCILAGDHNQLPPTIVSDKAAKEGLAITLMERLLKLYGDSIKKMLTVQYRMNNAIMQWPSEHLYENKLVADESVSSHLLNGLPGVEDNENTSIPLLLIDTAGCDLCELQSEDDESKGNEGEADLVRHHVESLIKSGMHPSDIAVITPYNLQVDLIKSRLSSKFPELEIRSVDGFQGREKEAIVLSLVRSNNIGEVGFLSEDRRINVAITRAKRHLAVICDSKTVSHHGFLKSFVEYCEEKGEVRTAFQYEKEIGHYPTLAPNKVVEKKEGNKPGQKKKPIKKEHTDRATNIKKVPDYLRNASKDVPLEMENEKRLVEEKFTQIIEEFKDGEKASYLFPTSLTAFERRIVHEISEMLGLIHISTGEGENRCIEIKKHGSTQSTSSEPLTTDDEMNRLKNKSIEAKIPDVTKSKGAEPKKQATKVKAVKPKQKVLKLKESNEDDFDALIEQAMKADKTCFYEKCKKSVAALSQMCHFCKGRFCFEHFLPEVHGCGDAAKAHARSQIRKDGVIYPGSGRPQKKMDAIKQSYLQKKLDEKLSELTNKRKPKPKS
ncbi:DNA-binding protein SMUBP-2 [Parasteatoda tepidariorum]|uniref:DNA-binding protein SMUBP-2 n=1 Tax=Parasteatoda tepidariorum TaxID=114398 RepID=UPI001C720438|nr:DNA-binding protein SMUBP-2 [Parasteatoda tepidariorum]